MSYFCVFAEPFCSLWCFSHISIVPKSSYICSRGLNFKSMEKGNKRWIKSLGEKIRHNRLWTCFVSVQWPIVLVFYGIDLHAAWSSLNRCRILEIFLGTRPRYGIYITQQKYTSDLLQEVRLAGWRLIDTPIETNRGLRELITYGQRRISENSGQTYLPISFKARHCLCRECS